MKQDGTLGCTMVELMYPPPISVPPQYSMTGLYPARELSHIWASGDELSPVDENRRKADQSQWLVASRDFQALTIDGT